MSMSLWEVVSNGPVGAGVLRFLLSLVGLAVGVYIARVIFHAWRATYSKVRR